MDAAAQSPPQSPKPTAAALGNKTQAVGFVLRLDTARAGVAAKLAMLKATPDVVDPKTKQVLKPADQTQAQLAIKVVQDRVDALPPQFDGVLIIASGTQDIEAGRSMLTLQIYGKLNHL